MVPPGPPTDTDRAGAEDRELRKVAAIQGQVAHRFRSDHLSDGRIARFKHLGADADTSAASVTAPSCMVKSIRNLVHLQAYALAR